MTDLLTREGPDFYHKVAPVEDNLSTEKVVE
jgi:hypothetical protein